MYTTVTLWIAQKLREYSSNVQQLSPNPEEKLLSRYCVDERVKF